jgi:hypothetical protein
MPMATPTINSMIDRPRCRCDRARGILIDGTLEVSLLMV